MLNEHTLDQLRILRLDGLIQALTDQATIPALATMSFQERLALLVQREVDWRDGKRLARLLKAAKLKSSSACIEDIDWRASRSLDRNLVNQLTSGDWLRHAQNVLTVLFMPPTRSRSMANPCDASSLNHDRQHPFQRDRGRFGYH